MSKSANKFSSIRKELIELISGYSNYATNDIEREAFDGSVKLYDAKILCKLLKGYKPKAILEVGSFLGFSTRWILEMSASWNAKVTAVDPNIRHRIFDQPRTIAMKLNAKFIPDRLNVVEAFFGPLVKCPYYYWLYETYEPKFDKRAIDSILDSKQIVDGSWPYKYDLIFIDGEHAYESVKSNFLTALNLLNKNGVIFFHDAYSHEGVAKLIKEIRSEYGEKANVRIYGGVQNKYKLFRCINRLVRFHYSDGLCEFSIKSQS